MKNLLKSILAPGCPALWLLTACCGFGQEAINPSGAQVLTNQVGMGHWAYFSVTLPPGYPGLVLTADSLSGTGGLELFVQSNANPTEVSFAKRSTPGTRILEMAAGELSAGEYRIGLLFQGAAGDTAAVNRLRLIPILAGAGGTLTNQVIQGQDLYFRVQMPAGNPGLRAWLHKTNHAGSELSLLRGDRPDPPNAPTLVRSALGSAPEMVWATEGESTPGNYLLRVAAVAAGTNTVALQWQPEFATTLTWDPGTNDLGSQVVTNPSPHPGGWKFYRINSQDTPVGAWRTVLRTTGAAQFWMQVGAPTGNPAGGTPGVFSGATSNSARLFYQGQYSPGQDWYLSVYAPPGSEWSLFSGEVYVQNLELLPFDTTTNNTAISSNATTAVGPEGVRFFRTTVTNGTPAWRLWLNNGAPTPATLARHIEVRQTRVPIPAAAYDLRQLGQMLVVSPYLNQANAFFLAVSGPEGLSLNLDNRVQRIENLSFGSNAVAQVMSGFRYRTYRVPVPADQIGWQVNARTLSGDVDLSLRQTDVGNEVTHLAFSGATGTTSDSITLVPPTLSDGVYHITIYGKDASTFTLQQGSPLVTDIPFVNSEAVVPGYDCPTCTNGPLVVNDDPDRNGWRYYRVNDLPSQLGVIGWLLSLSSNAPGTEIALRLSALPGRWSSGSHVDFSSTSGFLERQGHQAGVWYVGIYSPALALGEFRLETRPFLPLPVDLETGEAQVNNQRAGSWEYFELNVTNASLLGLEIQLTNTSGGGLRTQIRRDLVPYDNGSGMANASATPSWPSGFFVNGGGDWTIRARTGGNSDYTFLAMGWPLQLGKYYVGVRNDSGQPRTYGLRVATVGEAGQGMDHEILTLTNAPGSSVTHQLEPREFQIYRLAVTNGTRMLRLQLQVTSGEARFYLRRSQLPGLPGAYGTGANIFDGTLFASVDRPGSEIITVLPEHLQTNLPAGDYYVLVVAEGELANYNSGTIGTGTTTNVLTVLPEIGPEELGVFGPGQQLVIDADYTPPERKFYTVDVQPGVKALEIRLENFSGTSHVLWYTNAGLPQQHLQNYGWIGGWGGYQRITGVQHLIPPSPGRYLFTLETATGAGVPHSARLTLTTQDSLPLAALDGEVTITNQPPDSWRFFQVEVPALAGGDTPAAWDLTMVNPTSDALPMVVARAEFPAGVFTSAALEYPSIRTAWPTNGQVLADEYLTRRIHGLGRYSKQLHLGWGWPVASGTYYVGVLNQAAGAVSYQVRSRLVGGAASTLPAKVEDLAWTAPGILATISNLPAGEARYFRLNVPPGLPQFRLKLAQFRGEARMILRRGSVPGTHLYQAYFNTDDREIVSAAFGRVGDEHVSWLPGSGLTNAIPPGDYFITVISEGELPPDSNTLGTGAVDCQLELLPEVQPLDLGTLVVNDTLYLTNVTVWPHRPYYRLTVPVGARSLQIFHQNLTNQSSLLIRPGTNLIAAGGPLPPQPLAGNQSTWAGGEGATYSLGSPLVLSDPPPGVYTLVFDTGASTAASFASFNLSGDTPLSFTNGEVFYTNAPMSWRYFRVDVPTNADTELGVLGWELRLTNSPSEEGWSLVIRRDQLPPGGSFVNDANTSWPSGTSYGGNGRDWTDRIVPGMVNAGYFASMAWGRPLQPGTYYVGVYNGSAQARSIGIVSRAIGSTGSGLPIQVEPLTFGTSVQASNLAPGACQYYRLDLPPNQPGAKFSLRMIQGDARWVVRRGMVPGIYAGGGNLSQTGDQVRTAVPGNDYMVWWPQAPAPTLAADAYYLVVAAEGSPTNPDNGWLGTGPTAYEITSSTFIPENLGAVTPQNEVVLDAAFDAGEVLAYEFEITNTARALEVRLEDRVGNPQFDFGRGPGLNAGFSGWFGNNASTHLVAGARYVVLTDQPANRYWLAVGYHPPSGWPAQLAGSFQLRVRNYTPHYLNFSSVLNTNGQTNVFATSLADGQREYFTLEVPPALAGEPVQGWNLALETLQGNPQVRVRYGSLLPQDGNPDTSAYRTPGLILAPPYLRPGIWTVEVRANGDSQFVLTSEPVSLLRPAWAMPAYGEVTTNAGLAAPLFADSSILPDGTVLTEDVSLARDRYHFYAVDVPEGNGGLLRAELLALSGNSDLYVRAGNIPTLDHGPLYELSLVSGAISDFANWVPADTRRQLQLSPGRWYFMVHANGSNVRYRLKLGTGLVDELALDAGSALAQNLAANDWRYYRFVVPTNPPRFWNLSVVQQQGDVEVLVRDTAPPGTGYQVNPASWAREVKNAGVTYLDYTTPGSWQFTTPQVRPGHIYYVGVRAAVDSQFSLVSSTSGPLLTQVYPGLDYLDPEGGSVALTLAAFERRTWRVKVPPDALRWKHIATNSTAVGLYLQNGSPPWAARNNPADHWASSGAVNSIFETPLYDRAQGTWPWVRGETYFIAATNESAVAQDFYLLVDTRAWRLELAATNGTIVPSPNKPYYETGEIVTLTPQPAVGHRFVGWAEDLTGTNQPGQITMTAHRRVVGLFEPIPYEINVTAVGGTVQKSPNTPTHAYGSVVLLTATPSLGFEFVRWTGGLESYENPLLWQVTGDLNLTAEFRLVATRPVIVEGPQGGTFRAGQPLLLSVNAVGTPPLSYQWWKNGVALEAPDLPVLSFASLTTNDAGRYSVFITNVAGATLSAEAVVNVEFIRSLEFSNTTPIVIRDATSADPYPSIIPVSGVTAPIAGATVTLMGLNHEWLEDVDVLLAGPGTNVLVLSDAGRYAVTDQMLSLADEAAETVPEFGGLAGGVFLPSNFLGVAPVSDEFLSPAPPPPYGNMLSDFGGTNPNGDWQLFVMDDYGKDEGLIAGGWTLGLLTIETTPAPPATPMALQVETATVVENGEFGFSFAGMRGHTVRIESSTNLVDWVVVADIFVATGSEEFTEPVSGPGRFYRCQILP